MEPYLKSLDPRVNAMRKFVANYYSHGPVDVDGLKWPFEHLHKTAFCSNDDIFEPSISEEIHGEFMDAYRLLAKMPLVPHITDPTFSEVLQTWVEHVFSGSMNQSWNDVWTPKLIVHFYRRITPPEYQTRAHMQIVYTVAAAFDMATTNAIIIDDRIDQCDTRGGSPAWHISHPVTHATDAGVLTAIGKRALRFLVPDSHPCKREILDVYDDYNDFTTSYMAMSGARLQATPDEELRRRLYYPVEQVTSETHRAFTWMRAGYHSAAMHEAVRLLACYANVVATKDRHELYIDVLARGNAVLCVLDDIRDSRALGAGVPAKETPQSLDEYVEYVTDEMMGDFLCGETHQTFLLASLELGRGESQVVDLREDERTEIMGTLREFYWPKEQGQKEDPAVKNARTRRLTSMFLKYNLLGYLKEHVLARVLKEYFITYHRAVEVLGIPADLLSYPMGAMICDETETRPEHVATAVGKLMATPNRYMGEEEKFRRMLKLIQDI